MSLITILAGILSAMFEVRTLRSASSSTDDYEHMQDGFETRKEAEQVADVLRKSGEARPVVVVESNR